MTRFSPHLTPVVKKADGFSLIEVMLAMALTTLLVVGLSGLWKLVNDQFFQLGLRQKAVFVLHGHMEQLATWYRNPSNDTTIYPVPNTNPPRFIYKTESNTQDISKLVTKIDFIQGQVLYVSDNSPNVVWLDQGDNKVTAKLSWTLTSVWADPNDLKKCFPDTTCYRLTLSLEYPFRFIDTTNPVATMQVPTETLTLQTFIGRR